MTAVDLSPSPVAPPPARPTAATPTAATPTRRRPRLRRPAHEPEPVGGTTARVVPGLIAPIPVATPDRGDPPARTVVGPVRAPSPDDDLVRRATATVRTVVEVLAGRRAPSHLAVVARPAVVRYLTASRVTGPGMPTPPTRVHVSRPSRDVAEVVAVCRFGVRYRAITVRLDRTPGGTDWCATVVRLV